MALQIITVVIDTEKVMEYGTLILRVVPPREDLPNGTVLLHDPLSLPGFKIKVDEDAPTISIKSQFLKDELMPKTVKPAAVDGAGNANPANRIGNEVGGKPKLQLFRGKDKHGKK